MVRKDTVLLFVTLLVSFNFIEGSIRNEFSDFCTSESSNDTSAEILNGYSVKKRTSLEVSPEVDESRSKKFSSRQSLKSCLKEKSCQIKSSYKFVTFSPEFQDFVIDLKDPFLDQTYWRAVYANRFNLAGSITNQGHMISGSDYNFLKFQQILQSNSLMIKKTIDHLVKTQPQLFTQTFNCNRNVFQGIHQNTVDIILTYHPSMHGALEHIFIESLRNSELKLSHEFYYNVHPKRAWRRIDLAIESGQRSVINKCYLVPSSLACHNSEGETILSKAVIDHDIERIKMINLRADAGHLMLLDNNDGLNPIYLAVSDINDPEFSIFRKLFSVIASSFKNGKLSLIPDLIKEFINVAKYNWLASENLKFEIMELLKQVQMFENSIPDIEILKEDLNFGLETISYK